MRTKKIFGPLLFICYLFLTSCGDEDSNSPVLPGGCTSTSPYAIQVLQTNLACLPTNGFTNAENALGPPDAGTTGPGHLEFHGFVSLGVNGSVTLFMGSCIQDQAGPDLRVYQSVSREAVEVQVSQSADGPFVSLGMKDCVDSAPFFSGFCEFDLAGSGMNNVRIVRVFDREVFTFPGAACDNTGPSPGADIDAVQVVHIGG
jgi:hypothetical protein